jgi:hypothetical protein
MVLYPTAAVIDGHPPLPLMIIEFPALIALSLLSKFLPLQIRSLISNKIVFIEIIVGVTVTTISYGLFGYLIGRLFNKRSGYVN